MFYFTCDRSFRVQLLNKPLITKMLDRRSSLRIADRISMADAHMAAEAECPHTSSASVLVNRFIPTAMLLSAL